MGGRRRPLPSTSTRQGAIASARTRNHAPHPTHERVHTQPHTACLAPSADGGDLLHTYPGCGRALRHRHRFVGTLIFHRLVRVRVLCVCWPFSASRPCGSVKKNRTNFACNQRKCERNTEKFLWRCAAARAARKKCVFPMVEGDFPTPTFFRQKNWLGTLSISY